MAELRREIASLFVAARRAGAQDQPGDPDDFADLVLAIPEIRDALELKKALETPGAIKLISVPPIYTGKPIAQP